MEPEDQSNIPTRPVPVPGPPPSLAMTPEIAAAMLGMQLSRGSGGAWEPPSPEELQRDFPQYEIRGILGRGGMGAVYKGWQKSLDRLVAIKILPPGLDDGISGFTERFKREAKAMAQLEHPGIVAVYDAGTTPGGLLYFVMQCVTGTDVQKLVTERGRLDPGEALRITAAVCDALGYAHEHGLIHRDIKPSNIMLDERGTVKVADFGLAKSTAPETTMLTGSHVTMGTPDFMAPEAMQGTGNVDHRADLYAVGVMLYQMLTGKVPRGRFVPPSRAVPGLDKRLDAIVDKALQPERDARYSSALELRTAIEPILAKVAKRGGARPPGALLRSQSPGAPVQGESRSVPGGHAPPRRPLLIAIAAVVAILCIVAWFVFGKREPQLREPGRAAKAEQSSPALQRVEPSATDGRSDGLKPLTTLPGTASAFPPGKWTKVFTKAAEIAASSVGANSFTLRDGWIDGTGAKKPPLAAVRGINGRNQGVRLHGKLDPLGDPSFGSTISLRRSTDPTAQRPRYTLAFSLASNPRLPFLYGTEGEKTQERIASPKIDPTPDPAAEFDMELIAIGDKLYGKFNGKALPVVTDTRLTEGQIAIQTKHFVRDIEVINLDGLSEAEALKAAGLADVSPSPSPKAPGTASTFPPGKWTKVFAKAADFPAVVRGEWGLEMHDGWIDGKSAQGSHMWQIPGFKSSNEGIRLHGKMAQTDGKDILVCAMFVRQMTAPAGGKAEYRLSLGGVPRSVSIVHYAKGARTGTFTSIDPNSPLKPGEEFDMELIAIGDKLYGKFNGKPLPVVTDTRLTEGEMGFQTQQLARDIEVINLDGLSEAEALKAAGVEGGARPPGALPSSETPANAPGGRVPPAPAAPLVNGMYQFTPGQWVKVFQKFEEIPLSTREKSGVIWRDGWIDGSGAGNQQVVNVIGAGGQNRGIRLHGKLLSVTGEAPMLCYVYARRGAGTGTTADYRLNISGLDFATVRLAYTGKLPELASLRLDSPLKPGDEFDMELIAIGDKLHGKFNGKPLPVVTDTRLTEGGIGFSTKHLVRDVEILNLDGLSEAEARKAAGVEGK